MVLSVFGAQNLYSFSQWKIFVVLFFTSSLIIDCGKLLWKAGKVYKGKKRGRLRSKASLIVW